MTLGRGVCSEVFFLALCSVALSGHWQEKLLTIALLSEARAESFSSWSSVAEEPWFPEKPHGAAAPRHFPGRQKSLGLDNVK